MARCEHVVLMVDAVLWEPDQRLTYVYFPISSYTSLIKTGGTEGTLEGVLVGREGMGGIPLLGIDIAADMPLVQRSGVTYQCH
jgi:hypothetical protein